MEAISGKQPVLLIIIDGWGMAPSWGGNAISQAKTHFFDGLWKEYPHTLLKASGEAVGLPKNAPGNSEAGHLNIGAGHLVRQDLTLIDSKMTDGSFFKNQKVITAFDHVKKNNSRLHLMGLLSKTGTHSHIKHLYSLLNFCKEHQMQEVFIHLFSDGRDSDPMSGIEMVDEVEREIKKIGVGTIASVTGRFYAMDRDNRWKRVARAYNMLVNGEGEVFENSRAAFTSSYSKGITDEFIEPRLIANKKQAAVTISDLDSIIFFNFRSDRAKEITRAFLDENLPEMGNRKKLKDLYFATFVIYDDHLLSEQIFDPERVIEPLAKVWSDNSFKQFHIAETEKYPHVTYFINGGIEKPFPGEDRLMIPSPKKFRTYDLIPKMSAELVADSTVNAINKNKYDGIIVNFANPDMVGHTGCLNAAIQAIECVDECLKNIISAALSHNVLTFVMADHGNVEQMINPQTGEPDTEHSSNPVPFIIVGNKIDRSISLSEGLSLSSVAPTILSMQGLKVPESMTSAPIIKERAYEEVK